MADLFLLRERAAERREEGEEASQADAKAVLSFVNEQGRPPDDLLRFFDRKDHMLLQGRDADFVATSYFKSTACLKYWKQGGERHAYLTLNKAMATEVIRMALCEQRRRVEVLVFDRGGWVVDRRGSPGNLHAFEAELHSDAAAATDAVIVGVQLGRTAGSKGYSGNARLVGAAFIDFASRCIRTAEFEDDEWLSTLESVVCQQGARECVLPAELGEADKRLLEKTLELADVTASEARRGGFGVGDATQDLRRLLGVAELHGRLFESQRQLALSAACGVISYTALMAQAETHSQWRLEAVDPSQFMRLDAGALRALSVEPVPGEAEVNASLFGLLSRCKTTAGQRLLRKWLKQPLLSAYDIEQRLDIVAAFVSSIELRAGLRDEALPPMGTDLERLARKLYSGKGTLQDVVMLYQYVKRMPRLIQVLQSIDAEAVGEAGAALLRRSFVEPLAVAHSNFGQFLKLVEAAVDLEAVCRHEYLVLPHFSAALKALHEEREECHAKIDRHYATLQGTLGLDSSRMKLEQTAQHGFVLRVSRKEEKSVRSASGLTTLQTKKEGVLFRDAKMTKLAASYRELTGQYESEQAALVSKVVDTAATFCSVIQETQEVVARLDVLLCFAQVSATAPEPFVRPVLLPAEEGRRIELVGCRHPCVELMDNVNFIKNDANLTAGEASLQLVTGPNMGGKSTYIRSVGVSVLLAQVGCFVPCDEARISPVDAILARVGAGDVQSRGVSTFMAEMLETAAIIKNATPASLVIIDELGRGTSTYDGYGLAHAICSHLVKELKSLCLFATHFHELTSLASSLKGVTNKHVTAHADQNGFTMLYKVADGPADQSFGIHVAAASGFPKTVIAAAKRKLAELEEPQAGVAKRRVSEEERREGMDQVRRCLREFSSLPADALDTPHAKAKVALLKEQLRGSTNPLVAGLGE